MAQNEPQQSSSTDTLAHDARRTLRAALFGSLATVSRESGHPYASLVAVGTAVSGEPIILISELALHTKNLMADPRCSLLVAAERAADPLAAPRLTLIGSMEPTDVPGTQDRYVARHPGAAQFATFTDFRFWRMTVEAAHFVGGFGRIRTLAAASVILDDAGGLEADHAAIISEINGSRHFALQQLARDLNKDAPGDATAIGIDPEGLDIRFGDQLDRVEFVQRVNSMGAALAAVDRLTSAAKGGGT